MERSSYNPYNDESIQITVTHSQSNTNDDRAPFNDVIKHADIVSGVQLPKKLSHFPKWYQNPQRIYAAISVIIFAVFMMYQIVRIIMAIASGK